MRVGCVLIDHFPYKLETSRDRRLGGGKVIVFTQTGSRRLVIDASADADGVAAGMPLQEALALCRDAVPIEADIALYERAFGRILLRLGSWSPVVETAWLGCAYVGLDGLELTYGSQARLIDALLEAAPRHLEPRLGVAEGKFPAYLAALTAEAGRAYSPPMDVSEFLTPFSVDVLPVPWEVRSRLHGFGLHTLGQLAQMPIGPLQAQFGPIGARLWSLACGIDDSPLVPERPCEEVHGWMSLPTPTANLGVLMMAVESLLGRLFARPEMRGRFARTALLGGRLLDRPFWHRPFIFKSPVGDKTRAYFVVKASLEGLAIPGLLEEVHLTLKGLTGEVGKQGSLFSDVRRREHLREAVSQLKASQGCNPIYRMRELEPWSRIPERRRILVPYEP